MITLLTCAGTPVVAQVGSVTQAQIDSYKALPDATKVKRLIELAQNGDHEFAAVLLQRIPLSGPFAANRTLYIEGLILKARGDLTGAAKKYRAALADDPSLTLVRAELAKTLVILDEDDSAKHHLELLAADAPDQQAASAVRSFIDQVDAKRPYRISGYVAMAPTTNVNNGGSTEIVYLPQFGNLPFKNNNMAKKGYGVSAGLNGSYSKRLGNDFLGVATGGISANIYNEKSLNSYGASDAVELRRIIDGGYISFGAVGRYTTAGEDDDRTHTFAFGPRLGIVKQLGLRDTLSTSAVYEFRNTRSSTASDGKALLIDGSLTHAFDSTFNMSVGAGFDRVKLNDENSSYNAWSATLGFYKELPLGVTLNGMADFRNTTFDGMHSLIGDNREDKKLTTNATITKRDLNLFGFAPSISYTYSKNWSNVPLYDSNSHAIDFRLTKEF